MKRGFRGVPRPLLPAMLSIVDPSAGQEAPSVTQPQPSSSVVPPTPPTTQPIPSEATTIPPLSQPAPPTPIAETTTASPSPSPSPAHEPMEHTFEQPSSDQQPPTPRQEATTSQLMTRIDDLEKQLKETKQTFGKAILTLVERVKTLEVALKRKTKRLVTPSKTVNALGEEQVEDISPTTLEAAAILTKVQKIKSVDKGKRYKRRKSSKEFTSTGIEEINAGSLDVNTGIDPVTTDSIRVSVPSPDRSRREGKAPMIEEEETQASRKTKEQILQEEAGLAKAIRLDALEKSFRKGRMWPNKFSLDSLLAQRMAEEQELTEEQKKRKAQVQFEAQSYTEEDWDTIRAKLEANAELKESVIERILLVKRLCKTDGRLQNHPVNSNYKIIKHGRKVYTIVRENGTDMVYIIFGAMLTDISRDNLTKLYRIVMRKHGMNEPKDEFEKVLREYLKNMFEEPLSTDQMSSRSTKYNFVEILYACRSTLFELGVGAKIDYPEQTATGHAPFWRPKDGLLPEYNAIMLKRHQNPFKILNRGPTYTIAENDFKDLYPSDFKDLYLLNLQGHLNHLPPRDKKILSTAVNLWIKNLVIRQWVEDFQLGIESYQTQMNLTKPHWEATGLEFIHDYKILDSLRAVVFIDKYGMQMSMRFNEIHKFSDGTLQQIDEALDYRVKEFRVNKVNPGLNTRFWTTNDVIKSKQFMFSIQKRLKLRRIFWNLESICGGRKTKVRPLKTDFFREHNDDIFSVGPYGFEGLYKDGDGVNLFQQNQVVRDTEDTLDDASKSQQKVYEKMNDPIVIANKQNCWTIDYAQINALYKDFVPQKELSAEQKYFPSSFIPSDKN
ncbi:hypothetical protein Tco_0505145 [Tanacetum coccineum]